jgi:hypothetical protein
MTATQKRCRAEKDDMICNPGGDLNAASHDRVGTAADHTECYGYDDRCRLKTVLTNATVAPTADSAYAASPTAGPSPYNQTYSYDEIGNMLTGPAGSYWHLHSSNSNFSLSIGLRQSGGLPGITNAAGGATYTWVVGC